MIIIITIVILINITSRVILEKSRGGGESSKQGIQVAWSTPIHHVKWWISRFRGIYRVLAASEGELFLISLNGFWPLCYVTRSLVLVVAGVLYLPLHFIIINIAIIIIIINIIIVIIIISFVNFIFILSVIIRTFIKISLLFLWGK